MKNNLFFLPLLSLSLLNLDLSATYLNWDSIDLELPYSQTRIVNQKEEEIDIINVYESQEEKVPQKQSKIKFLLKLPITICKLPFKIIALPLCWLKNKAMGYPPIDPTQDQCTDTLEKLGTAAMQALVDNEQTDQSIIQLEETILSLEKTDQQITQMEKTILLLEKRIKNRCITNKVILEQLIGNIQKLEHFITSIKEQPLQLDLAALINAQQIADETKKILDENEEYQKQENAILFTPINDSRESSPSLEASESSSSTSSEEEELKKEIEKIKEDLTELLRENDSLINFKSINRKQRKNIGQRYSELNKQDLADAIELGLQIRAALSTNSNFKSMLKDDLELALLCIRFRKNKTEIDTALLNKLAIQIASANNSKGKIKNKFLPDLDTIEMKYNELIDAKNSIPLEESEDTDTEEIEPEKNEDSENEFEIIATNTEGIEDFIPKNSNSDNNDIEPTNEI